MHFSEMIQKANGAEISEVEHFSPEATCRFSDSYFFIAIRWVVLTASLLSWLQICEYFTDDWTGTTTDNIHWLGAWRFSQAPVANNITVYSKVLKTYIYFALCNC